VDCGLLTHMHAVVNLDALRAADLPTSRPSE
jgi:hypothetical protein